VDDKRFREIILWKKIKHESNAKTKHEIIAAFDACYIA
jgi:hypothetical protein